MLDRWPWDDSRLPRMWVKDYRDERTTELEAFDQVWIPTDPPLGRGLVVDWGMAPRSWHQWGTQPKRIVRQAGEPLDRDTLAQQFGGGLLSDEDKHFETLAYEERALAESVARNPNAVDRAFEDRRLSIVTARPDQGRFRRALAARHGQKCCISECDVLDALEAAHIIPFAEGTAGRDLPSNGLLLRRDIHRLFDLLRISVDPANFSVWIAPDLRDGPYGALHGSTIDADAAEPALAEHFRRATARADSSEPKAV